MKPALPKTAPHRGVAAIELSIFLLLFLAMLAFCFMGGRLLYTYTMLKQATQNAALYMSGVPPVALTTLAGANTYTDRADAVFRDTAAAAGIRPDARLSVTIQCDSQNCGRSTLPAVITVRSNYDLDASLFGFYFGDWTSGSSLWNLGATSTVAYAH